MRTARVWSRRNKRPVELIAVYTDPDVRAPFVQMADRALALGSPFMVDDEGVRKSSYLDVPGMVALCLENKVSAVWPGWGFLGESAEFSQACAEAGITFIGPGADVMRLLGDKVRSKAFAEKHDVPVSPWSGGTLESMDEVYAAADKVGFPLILKAAAGGGGRGIRLVRERDELPTAFTSATNEAVAAFGDGSVFIEKYVEDARHVEVQILADAHGNVWSLGTRDCSVQRRHQKVLEETPAPNLPPGVEDSICAAARRMAGACGYLGAGTAEFLLLPDLRTFYFLEMNARLQVEHTITECVFGLDLVDAQIDIALGHALPAATPPERRGAAIEARLNAEEPDMGFAPAGGTIRAFDTPGGPGVRVDSGFRAGDSVVGAFDSNIAKIIAQGRDREEAIARLEQALRDTRVVIDGGLTNRAMILEILTDDDFVEATHSTRWLDSYLQRRPRSVERPFLAQSIIAAALFDFVEQRRSERADLFANVHAGPPQSLSEPQPSVYRYLVDGQVATIALGKIGPTTYQITCDQWSALCEVENMTDDAVTFVTRGARYSALSARGAGWIQINTHDVSHRFERIPDGRITSDMAAVITQICVEAGQQVERGERLMTLEVMKMEIHLDSPMSGVIDAIHVSPATQVAPGTVLLELSPGAAGDQTEEDPALEFNLDGDDQFADPARVILAGMLGYDVTEAQFSEILRHVEAYPNMLDVHDVLDSMEALVIQHELFLAGPYDDGVNEARESSYEQTIWFLMHRRLDENRLSAKVLHRLERLFALHEVDDIEDSEEIESVLFRLLQTNLRDVKRHQPLSILIDTLLARWGNGDLDEEATERAIPLLDQLVEITTQRHRHQLTLRAQHLAHRLRGFTDDVTRREPEEENTLLDMALVHTVTLHEFEVRPLPLIVNHRVRAALAVANDDENDRRVLTVSTLEDFAPADQDGELVCPHVNDLLHESIDELRQTLLDHQFEGPWHFNRITLFVPEALTVDRDQMLAVVRDLPTEQMLALELEKLVVISPPREDCKGWKVELTPSHAWNGKTTVATTDLENASIQNLSKDDHRELRARRRRQLTPEQISKLMCEASAGGTTAAGAFTEYDLEGEALIEVGHREPNQRNANLIVGMMNHPHERFTEGLERVVIIGDVTRTMGSLAEPECRRVIAALDLAESRGLPVEWIAFSSGAKISFESGTENLDWTARALRRIIEFTEAGGPIHVLVDGPCVGAQSYWNAEATMLNHCRGALFMTPRGYMILTGKRALEHSGCVSASSNEAIGGLQVMAPNGEAQYIAPTLADAYDMLLRHYALTYIAPSATYTTRIDSNDPVDRDVSKMPYTGQIGDFNTIGEIFSDETNPGRKKPFDIRSVMTSVLDADVAPLERWPALAGGESAVVFHGQLGGQPICMVGIESMPVQRKGMSPTHGPSSWTSGTLYPESSRKVARAIHASSGVQPVVVLANLSGFDGSPESLANRQLEFGAEIGRAVVKFDGPIIFCVISRYHGGAYVVFSQGLNDRLESLALEGTFASVIGGGPAAAVVFPRLVRKRYEADDRVLEAREKAKAGEIDQVDLDRVERAVYAEIQSGVAKEFDNIHTVQRAKEVGSLSAILDPTTIRAALVNRTHSAVERYLGER